MQDYEEVTTPSVQSSIESSAYDSFIERNVRDNTKAPRIMIQSVNLNARDLQNVLKAMKDLTSNSDVEIQLQILNETDDSDSECDE